MTWIKSHIDLARHPKIYKLARILGVSVPTTIGYIHLLWYFCLEYIIENGDLSKYEPADIANAVKWEGNPQDLIDALIKAGFVDDNLQIHDWLEKDHVGGLLAERARKAESERQRRAAKKKDANDNTV